VAGALVFWLALDRVGVDLLADAGCYDSRFDPVAVTHFRLPSPAFEGDPLRRAAPQSNIPSGFFAHHIVDGENGVENRGKHTDPKRQRFVKGGYHQHAQSCHNRVKFRVAHLGLLFIA
jgi:hypothetical protein